MHDVYRECAQDLDHKVGAWVDELEASAFFERGHFILTSDHGEAFQEHGQMGHGGTPWEEKVRIPLLFRGPGLVPRTVDHAASLVDLPATIASLARVPVPASWAGESLLALEEDRTVLAFDGVPSR